MCTAVLRTMCVAVAVVVAVCVAVCVTVGRLIATHCPTVRQCLHKMEISVMSRWSK